MFRFRNFHLKDPAHSYVSLLPGNDNDFFFLAYVTHDQTKEARFVTIFKELIFMNGLFQLFR